MIVMPANNSGLFIGYLAGRFPGRLGWLIGPGGWREPHNFMPYALDNGAFPAWTNQREWSAEDFYSLCERTVGRKHKPSWIAVPDVVANREATLDSWEAHSSRVRNYAPVAFVVQDGMTVEDVPADADLVFVGGSTEWKWNNLEVWTKNFPRVHVGRVNSERLLWLSHNAGAESCDGTGWLRGDKRQLNGLVRYLEQSTSSKIFFSFPPKHQNMKPSTKAAIAGLLSAAGSVLSALATEFAEGQSTETTEPPKTRKPRNTNNAAPAAAAEPVAPAPEPEATPEPETQGGKTYEELQALIRPLVTEGRGEEVKKVIAKYSTGGLKTMEPKNHAAFEKEIAAMSY